MRSTRLPVRTLALAALLSLVSAEASAQGGPFDDRPGMPGSSGPSRPGGRPASPGGTSTSAASSSATRGMSAKERYEFALRLMRQGSTTRAMEEFQRVRNYHRDDPVSVLAALAIADLHFQKGEYEQARYAYEEFAQYHPRHEHLDYVTWRIGYAIYKRAPKAAGRDQASTRSAVNAWTGFTARFPESEWVDDVNKLLAECKERLASKELWIARFYARRAAWRAVEGRASDMLRRYPDSEQADMAWYLLGTARHRTGAVEAAQAARQRLAEAAPESPWLAQLDQELARPAGTPPEERTFLRPYRMPGMGAVPGQPAQ